MAQSRDAAQRRSLESEELLMANEFVKDKPIAEDEDDAGDAPTGMVRTQAQSHHNVCAAKLADMEQEIEKKHKALIERIENWEGLHDADDHTGTTEMKATLLDLATKARQQLTGQIKNDLDAWAKDIKDAKTAAQLKRCKGRGTGILKDAKDHAVKTLHQEFGKTKKFLSTQERVDRKKAKPDADADGAAPVALRVSPMNAVMKIMKDTSGFDMSTCVYEAKAGIKAAIVEALHGKDPVHQLASSTAVKKHIKDVKQHILTTGSRWSHQFFIPTTPNGKKTCSTIRRGFDPLLTTKLVLPDMDWAQKIYAPDLVIEQPMQCAVGPGVHCCGECRIYLESDSHILIGFPYAAVPGNRMADKREHLGRLTIDALGELMAKTSNCWMREMHKDECCFIPTGHIVMSANNSAKQVVYIRWAVGNNGTDAADTSRVRMMLVEMLNSFPELKAPANGLAQFLEFLGDQGF